MGDSYKRMAIINRNLVKSNTNTADLTDDLRNDLLLAFDLFKNEENKVNKLKLRTILFSFAMYKSAPKHINDYIAEFYPKEDEFTFEQVLKLVMYKMKNIKETEAETLFNVINGGKTQSSFNKADMTKAFELNGIEISDKEINEMMSFMIGNDKLPDEELLISKEEFRKFLV